MIVGLLMKTRIIWPDTAQIKECAEIISEVRSDSERGIGRDQPLNVRGNKTSNIEERVGDGYQVIDR
jgi:hypothetical protein